MINYLDYGDSVPTGIKWVTIKVHNVKYDKKDQAHHRSHYTKGILLLVLVSKNIHR